MQGARKENIQRQRNEMIAIHETFREITRRKRLCIVELNEWVVTRKLVQTNPKRTFHCFFFLCTFCPTDEIALEYE